MRIVFGLALLGAIGLVACGSSSNKSSGSGGADANGGDGNGTGGKHSGSGGAGTGDAGDAGESSVGVGGAIQPPVVSAANPHTAGGIVAAGVVAHSAHFTGVFSLGAAPGGNGVSTSKSKTQLRGGVLGASQK